MKTLLDPPTPLSHRTPPDREGGKTREGAPLSRWQGVRWEGDGGEEHAAPEPRRSSSF